MTLYSASFPNLNSSAFETKKSKHVNSKTHWADELEDEYPSTYTTSDVPKDMIYNVNSAIQVQRIKTTSETVRKLGVEYPIIHSRSDVPKLKNYNINSVVPVQTIKKNLETETELSNIKKFMKKYDILYKLTLSTWIILFISIIIITIIGFQQKQKTGYHCLSSICTTGSCLCNLTSQYWDGSNCLTFLSYNTACSAALGVNTNSTVCKNTLNCRTNGSSCNCPSTVSVGYCDCPPRSYGVENYWDGSYCVNAQPVNAVCSKNYMCQYLTQNTACINGACKCIALQYFNLNHSKCEDMIDTGNLTCFQVDACRSDLGLSCQGNLCQCNASVQFWNGSICIDFFISNLTCPSPWVYFMGSCLRLSTSTFNSWVDDIAIPNSIGNECYSQVGAKIANGTLVKTGVQANVIKSSNGFSDSYIYYE